LAIPATALIGAECSTLTVERSEVLPNIRRQRAYNIMLKYADDTYLFVSCFSNMLRLSAFS